MSAPLKLAVVMDPIASITFYKDTTLALLLAAQADGFELHYAEPRHLSLRGAEAYGQLAPLTVFDDAKDWFKLGAPQTRALADMDVILMRKDPPFDMQFVHATYLLERAERAGVLVVNNPRSLRDCNEKLFATEFPECCPPLLVSQDLAELRAFHREHGDVIFKPLEAMGGTGIFRCRADDPNVSVILETLTLGGRQLIMAQRFIPAISAGDKRILMIDGEPVPYSLARIPASGETRGNLAAGGRGVAQPLGERDRWIAAQVGPRLREKGLLFVGLDVIGDYLTEVNVTSPTCAREIDAAYNFGIGRALMSAIRQRLGR